VIENKKGDRGTEVQDSRLAYLEGFENWRWWPAWEEGDDNRNQIRDHVTVPWQ
jgi:murein L,D-transpeptidase YafK